jgi:hypothetical protein
MSANDPKRTLFALTAEAEATRPDAALIELLLGRSVIGSRGVPGDAVTSHADNTKTQGSGG